MFRKIVVILLTLITVLTFGASLVGCNDNDYNVSDDVVISNVENEVVGKDDCVNQVTIITPTLRLSEGVSTVADNSKTKTILASVYPSNAVVKDLIWSVAWGNYSGSKDVTEYISITPGDGRCTITCHKSFNDSYTVLVTAKAVDNANVSATCTVSYTGLPDYYTCAYGITSSYMNMDYIHNVSVGGYCLFTLDAHNYLGIGNSYSMSLEFVDFGASGTFTYNGSSTVSLSNVADKILEDIESDAGSGVWCTITSSLESYVNANYGTFNSVDGYFYLRVKDNANNGELITIKFIC